MGWAPLGPQFSRDEPTQIATGARRAVRASAGCSIREPSLKTREWLGSQGTGAINRQAAFGELLDWTRLRLAPNTAPPKQASRSVREEATSVINALSCGLQSVQNARGQLRPEADQSVLLLNTLQSAEHPQSLAARRARAVETSARLATP